MKSIMCNQKNNNLFKIKAKFKQIKKFKKIIYKKKTSKINQ